MSELKVGQRWVYQGGESRRDGDDVITKITKRTISAVDDSGHVSTWTPTKFREWHPSLREPEAAEPTAEPTVELKVELKVGQRWMYREGEDDRGCDDVITKVTSRQVTTTDDNGTKRTWTPKDFRHFHPRLREPEAAEPEPFKVGDFVTVTASQAELDAYCAGALPGHTYRVGKVYALFVRLEGISMRNGPDVEFGHFRRATDVEIAGMLRPDAPAPTIVCTSVTYAGDVNGVLRLDGRPDHVGVEVRMANGTEPVIVEVPFADAPRIGDKVTITFARGA